MIDLDGLEEHLKEIIDDGRGGERYTKAENVMALVQRLRQAEKDAARYRWLRRVEIDGLMVITCDDDGVPETNDGDPNCVWGDGLDSLIDEAMNGSNN